MNRRDEGEFPFAYLSEPTERKTYENHPASPGRRSNTSAVSRSMNQQIQILMLIAFATLLIFLILLYITITTVTSRSDKTDNTAVQTSISQSIESTSETIP